MFSIKTDIDFRDNNAVNAKHNPLSTINRTGLILSTADEGYCCFDTDLNKPFYWTGIDWVTYGDVFPASQVVSGTIELATQAETNLGLDSNKAITPETLKNYISFIGVTKSFLLSGVSIAAGTPFLITFPTTASHKDAFMCSLKDATGNQVFADVDSISTTGFTITSNSTLLNLTIFTTYI
jgi:hypothetical protein